jgi:hypothetical protein
VSENVNAEIDTTADSTVQTPVIEANGYCPDCQRRYAQWQLIGVVLWPRRALLLRCEVCGGTFDAVRVKGGRGGA